MNTKILKGILDFYTWRQHWFLTTQDGKGIDFLPNVLELFRKLNGQSVSFVDKFEEFSFCYDVTSDWKFEFEETPTYTGAVLVKDNKTSASFMNAHIPMVLQRLNGRKVIITFTDNSMKLVADQTEEILVISYTGSGNCADIPAGKEKEICQFGTLNQCIFCSGLIGGHHYVCMKGDPLLARDILTKLQNNKSEYSRIGNCLVKGRV